MAFVAPLLEKSRVFDTTSTLAKILCCGTQKQLLHLDPEEAVLKTTNCISSTEKRLPYGELGSVDQSTNCCCLQGFSSNLSDANEHGTKTPIVPGCGCAGGLVDDIVAELQARMKGRGNTGNMHRSEEAILRQRYLNDKVELILKQMGITAPSKLVPANAQEHKLDDFPQKNFIVTPCCLSLCCGKAELHLEGEEVQYIKSTPCSKEVKRFPYGKLGDVASAKMCGCFVVVQSQELGGVSPGCGCDANLVQQIADELKVRMKARGDTGNIQRQEFANKLAKDQDKMVDAILQHLRISVPDPPPALQMPPVAQTM
jgi:hypothetical protein